MTIWKEIGYSWRVLKRKPGFAMAVILCFGLGIGAVTAVLSVINGVTMRFMPYERPGRIVFLIREDDSGSRIPAVSARYFLDWKERNASFSDMAVYQRHEPHTGWSGWSETQENLLDLQGMIVTPNFFSVLGMRTLLGRALTDNDQGMPVIVLSCQVWRDKFAEDPQIIGRSILLGGRAREVIGIAAHNYRFFPTYYGDALNRRVDYWMPVSRNFESETRTNWNYAALARLKHGTTIAQAQTDIDRITRLQHEQYVDDFPEDIRIHVQSMPQTLVGSIRSVTFLILAAAAFVLMIACANVINLFLVHSMRRKTEMAVRSALGSSRLRIIRQMICENMVFALLGGILGILVAQWGMDLLLSLAPRNLPGVDEICLDSRVFAVALVVTLLCAFVVGLIPGISASRLNLSSVLKGFGMRSTFGFRERQTIRWIVISEIVLSIMLIIGASLLIRSYWRLMQVELGFQSDRILTLRLSSPNLTNRHDELLERLQSLPDVELAASSTGLPLSGEPSDYRLVSPVPAEEAPESYLVSYVRTVSMDYFRVLGTSLAHGRYFTMQDNKNSSPVVIVNEALARKLWPEEDTVGRQMDFGDGTRIFYDGSGETLVQRRVVGVVRNIRYEGPDVDPPLEAFIPFAQRTRSHYMLSIALHCRGNPTGLMQAVRREVRSVDESFKIESMSTIERFYSELTAHRRFLMAMFSVFAAIAFTLVVIGIYGVVAFTVSMRNREMGIRIAFGAQRRDIFRLVMKHAAGLTMTGVGFGLLGAFVLHKVIASQLFGISSLDPLTIAIGILLGTLVPLIACYIPARRAAKIDPMEALRYE